MADLDPEAAEQLYKLRASQANHLAGGGDPIGAACCWLTVERVDEAVHALLNGHEPALAWAVAGVLGTGNAVEAQVGGWQQGFIAGMNTTRSCFGFGAAVCLEDATLSMAPTGPRVGV